jgi:hypothetical protein
MQPSGSWPASAMAARPVIHTEINPEINTVIHTAPA